MIDLPFDVVFDILEDRETALKLCKKLAGCRIYFPKDIVKTLDIQEEYRELVKSGYYHKSAVEYLSEVYQLSRKTIEKRLNTVV